MDKAAIDFSAADIFIRKSEDHRVHVQFHLSLIPATYQNKHAEYINKVVGAWKAVDSSVAVSNTILGSYNLYNFSLRVPHEDGKVRVTEVFTLFLDSQRYLEIFLIALEDTNREVLDEMKMMVSTLVAGI